MSWGKEPVSARSTRQSGNSNGADIGAFAGIASPGAEKAASPAKTWQTARRWYGEDALDKARNWRLLAKSGRVLDLEPAGSADTQSVLRRASTASRGRPAAS